MYIEFVEDTKDSAPTFETSLVVESNTASKTSEIPPLEENIHEIENIAKQLPTVSESISLFPHALTQTALNLLPSLYPVAVHTRFYHSFQNIISQKSYADFLPKFKTALLQYRESNNLLHSFDNLLRYAYYPYSNLPAKA